MLSLGIALAVVATGCYVVAARTQHVAVSGATGGGKLTLRMLGGLFRDRRWLVGLLALGGGAGMHAVSLAFAPLAVVQPIGVLVLVTTALVQARAERRRLTARVVAAIAAATFGIAGFVILAAGHSQLSVAPDRSGLLAVGCVSVLVLAAVAVGAAGPRRSRCVAFGVAGGSCYGLVSVLVHMVGLEVRFGTLAGAALPAVGTAVTALVGGWLVQHAYASGPPDVVMACTNVVDPLVAIGIGAVLLGESGGSGALVTAAETGCAVLAIAGVAAMARFRALQGTVPDPGAGQERPAAAGEST